METTIVLKDGMAFDCELEGHHFMIDADSSNGGTYQGPRPKGLLLTALAGCTGMDVAAILRKMRLTFDSLEVKVTGDMREEHPRIFTKIKVHYILTGASLQPQKVLRAVNLSETTYCGVSAMLKCSAPIEIEITLNGQNLEYTGEEV